MSSTNKTANYNLTQFIGSDKPAWLVDYNGDMAAIDTQMKVNADAAAAAQSTANGADGKADANATAISSLNTQINGASGIADDLSSVQGAVNTINSLIGNGEPTTTDKTIIGAINELNGDKADSSEVGNLSALTTTVKTDVVSAVNEVDAYAKSMHSHLAKFNNTYALGGVSVVTRTGDGVKTIREILDEIATTIKGYMTDFTKIRIDEINIAGYAPMSTSKMQLLLDNSDFNISFNGTAMPGSDRMQIAHCELKSAGNSVFYFGRIASDSTITFGDASTTVLPNGNTIEVQVENWKNIGTLS